MLGITVAELPRSHADHELAPLGAIQRKESANSCLCCRHSIGCPLRRYFEPLEIRCVWFHHDCPATMLSKTQISVAPDGSAVFTRDIRRSTPSR